MYQRVYAKIALGTLFLAIHIQVSLAQLATLYSKKILATMPVFAKIDTLLQEESQRYVPEYAKKRNEVQTKIAIADSLYRVQPKSKQTDMALSAAEKAQSEWADFEKKIQQKLMDYRNLLLTPYYDKVNAAVKAVAQRLKYSQVLDIQTVNFVYIDPARDITEEVIKQLKQ